MLLCSLSETILHSFAIIQKLGVLLTGSAYRERSYYDCINTIYQFITPVLDNKSIFEEYGAFKGRAEAFVRGYFGLRHVSFRRMYFITVLPKIFEHMGIDTL